MTQIPRTVLDISVPLDARTLVYPGDPPFRREIIASIRGGDSYNLSAVSMSAHLGTHIDAPFHFLERGATLDAIDPARWVSDAVVVDTGDARAITADHARAAAPRPGLSVLFRTRNSVLLGERIFVDDFCALTLDAARLLAEAGVNAVGIDYLSVESYADPAYPVHGVLLSAGVLIAENLDLRLAEPGEYTLVLAPLRIAGADGAPARALLLR